MKSTITPQQRFATVQSPKIQRSVFDRSHGLKTTFNSGKLYPIFVDEALPGDSLNLKTTLFGRLSTPLVPTMDNIFFDVHYFSVPYRLVWSSFVKMMGEQKNPSDHINYIIPTMTSPVNGYDSESIYDYFGLPTLVPNLEHSSLFLRAYNLIWNEWYRDENLQNSVSVNTSDSSDNVVDFTILPRGKRKDYFTSALPWTQKGDSVMLPLGDIAPVGSYTATDGFNIFPMMGAGSPGQAVYANNSMQSPTLTYLKANGSGNVNTNLSAATNSPILFGKSLPTGNPTLQVDLSAATAATINELRQAFQIQRMFERDARGGTRYTELIRSHFGVISPDARLQRPEYLGGGSFPLKITPVAQTSGSTDNGTAQGNLAGFGTFSASSKGFNKTFTEHEIIIGLVSARADLNYQQGLNKMWSRSTRFDFYWPSFAHLGEQAILNKEIYAQGNSDDDKVFGYQERYAEYRYKPSQVTGVFRSNHSQSLDIWHLSQDFGSLPYLNDSFIQENPPVDRVLAVQDEPQFIMDCYFQYRCARPIPTYSTPGLIDHF